MEWNVYVENFLTIKLNVTLWYDENFCENYENDHIYSFIDFDDLNEKLI